MTHALSPPAFRTDQNEAQHASTPQVSDQLPTWLPSFAPPFLPLQHHLLPLCPMLASSNVLRTAAPCFGVAVARFAASSAAAGPASQPRPSPPPQPAVSSTFVTVSAARDFAVVSSRAFAGYQRGHRDHLQGAIRAAECAAQAHEQGAAAWLALYQRQRDTVYLGGTCSVCSSLGGCSRGLVCSHAFDRSSSFLYSRCRQSVCCSALGRRVL
jgi:hypothetical protein